MDQLERIATRATVDDVLDVMREAGVEPTRDGALILLDRHVTPRSEQVREAALAAQPSEPSFSDEVAARDVARRETVRGILAEAGLLEPQAGPRP